MTQVKWKKAFSLIELMVVVALLAIVSLIALRQFGGDLLKSRDSQRKRDLQMIKMAMENYYNDRDTYPPLSYLDDCGGTALQPYLKKVPCDPVTGKPYLYLPELVSGEKIHAYRILSLLSNLNDPIIEQLGCQNGCGISPAHQSFADSSQYVYGIAEGVPLVLSDSTVDPTLDCTTDLCYCCGGSNQSCNVYTTGFGNCIYGPYATNEQCLAQTVCGP